SMANCLGVSGSSTIADLVIDGVPITVTGAPNQTVMTPVGTLIINEQIDSSAGDHHEITVNALHLLGAMGGNVFVSHANSDVNCVTAPAQVPEPGALALLIGSLSAVRLALRRRR